VDVEESNRPGDGPGDSDAPTQAAKTTLFAAGRRVGSRKKRQDGDFFPMNKER